MKHTIELDDLELTALISHLEGQSEMMCESRLNCSNPSEMPDREEVLLNLIYARAFTLAWEADKNPKLDFDLIQNQIFDFLGHLRCTLSIYLDIFGASQTPLRV